MLRQAAENMNDQLFVIGPDGRYPFTWAWDRPWVALISDYLSIWSISWFNKTFQNFQLYKFLLMTLTHILWLRISREMDFWVLEILLTTNIKDFAAVSKVTFFSRNYVTLWCDITFHTHVTNIRTSIRTITKSSVFLSFN